jgi:hypothetical protein
MPEEPAPAEPPSGGISEEREVLIKVMRQELRVSKALGLNYLLYVPERVQGTGTRTSQPSCFCTGLVSRGRIHPLSCDTGSCRMWRSIPIFPLSLLRRSVLGTHGGRSWRMGLINSFFTAEQLFPSIVSGFI